MNYPTNYNRVKKNTDCYDYRDKGTYDIYSPEFFIKIEKADKVLNVFAIIF